MRFEKDLDHGLGYGEDTILATAAEKIAKAGGASRGRLLARVTNDLARYLDSRIVFEELIERVAFWPEPREFAAGETLAERGPIQTGAHFLVAEEVSINDPAGRLYQCGPGDVLEPWAAFSKDLAALTVEARTACRTMMLDPARMNLLQGDDDALALILSAQLIRPRSAAGGMVSPPPC